MNFEHGGNVHSFARNENFNIDHIIDFSANINPLGCSAKGFAALQNALKQIVHYPDPTCLDLKKAIYEIYDTPLQNILIGNGAAELIYALCRLSDIERAVVFNPTFSEYRKAAEASGLQIQEINTQAINDFAVSIEDVQEQDFKNAITFLAHPNNPNGQLLDFPVLENILNKSKYVLIDESFIDFIYTDKSYRQLIHKYKNLLILHSYTKFYAVPGLRIGALYAQEELIEKLSPFIPTWSANTLAQAYAQAAIKDKSYIEESKNFMAKEHMRMYLLYKNLSSLRVIKPTVNFMLMELLSPYKVADLEKYLKQFNILIRSCHTFQNLGQNWFRIAIKTSDNNDFLYNKIKEFLNE